LPVLRDLEQIVEIARKREVYLFSDEMYMFLEQDPGTRLPSACDVYEKAVCLGGVSKTFGMAGARIGWLATRDAGLMERLAQLKDYTTICSSAPSEVLATIALKSADRIIAENLERIKKNLDILDDFFDRHVDVFYWDRPPAGTVGFPRLLSSKTADEFCGAMISAAGVLLLPASVFDFGQSHFRVGFGREDLPGAVEALEACLPEAGL
ncbi:MAG TPA: aminotransferase class I/II-fold pyridoxal phosphate-dependent enzyme, partial [Candidatus Anoxymicrobiaceae bacterium]